MNGSTTIRVLVLKGGERLPALLELGRLRAEPTRDALARRLKVAGVDTTTGCFQAATDRAGASALGSVRGLSANGCQCRQSVSFRRRMSIYADGVCQRVKRQESKSRSGRSWPPLKTI